MKKTHIINTNSPRPPPKIKPQTNKPNKQTNKSYGFYSTLTALKHVLSRIEDFYRT